ncbi:DASS family sodium-coupled anion symporter [Nostocoides sp. F2B08]|uniref:SLC13 family permease n=1 Tax=Nostocoides sp. F2B08 TaxID=2653936 RepID=UPI001D03BEB3|nr:DASS family sodium-coupled anion symporter [Tetrasphaera sp. F2B08]
MATGRHLREKAARRAPGHHDTPLDHHTVRIRWIGLAAGLFAAALVYTALPNDLATAAKVTAATATLMGIWWMTEAIPIPATALVPLIVFPIASDVDINTVGASYGNSIIFLFMGGFMLALAMQRWDLHRRIALRTVRAMGTRPPMVVAGFMLATAFLSMWVSNTATAVMMIPIGVSVLVLVTDISASAEPPADPDHEEQRLRAAVIESDFGTALILGIAYAASIGSLATIIGTPPNTLLVGYLREAHGISIGFGQWMLVGLPLAAVFLAIAWALLTKVLFRPEIDEIPGGRGLIDDEIRILGPASTAEKRVAAVFTLAAVAWVTTPLIWPDNTPITDAGIAMVAAFLLFVLPAGAQRGVRVLPWHTAEKLPWGVLLLFGGGLALSAQFGSSGLTEWIGEQTAGLGGLPVVLMLVILTGGIIFLTELTSNTATAATFLPVAGGVALGIGADPLLLAIPVALAATCAFMLPVATPPNAIAFGSGYVTIGQMVRGGLGLNLIGIVLITCVVLTIAAWVFSIAY